MKKLIWKYSPIIIGIIIGLMFGDRLFGGFFYLSWLPLYLKTTDTAL